MELPLQLQELLPRGYSYKLKRWLSFKNEPTHFETVILTNIYTEEEAQEWWHKFNIKSNTTMRVRATCPKTGKVNIFKIYLRCLHQGRAEKHERLQKSKSVIPLKRNTNCPAGMIVAIRRVIKYSRSKKRDPVDPIHPCEIQIRFVHNHPTKSADSLRFRPVSKEAEDKILSLYQEGHSPSSALETLKIDLQIKHGPLFSQIVSDRFHCPDKSFCYRLYYKHFGKDYASSAKKDIRSLLTSKVSHYNTILGDNCLAVGISGAEYVIAACTPLMKRSHNLVQCRDIVYVELYESPPGNKDRFEHHILLLNAHTSAGGVPLGVILTTSNSIAVLTLGFQLLKQLIPGHAFCGRGVSGPQAFLIEDSDNQKSALNSVWPDSDVIICIFRILQSIWRWLWDEKHNILKDHRLYLLYLLKTILFASSDSEMTDKYQSLCADSIALHYPTYLHQVESLWQRRHLWGICFHRLLPLQNASNYYEAAVRALKDKSFEQARTFNIIQLLSYLVTRLDIYYQTKFLNILKEKIKHIFLSHFPNTIPSHIENNIKQIAGNYYLVPSENEEETLYTVDAELNSCSCLIGLNGALCIHQYWVFLKMPSDMFKADISDPSFKEKLFIIASGSTDTCNDTISANLNASSELNNLHSSQTTPVHNLQSILENLVTDAITLNGTKSGVNQTYEPNNQTLKPTTTPSVESSNSFPDIIPVSSPLLLTSSSIVSVPSNSESCISNAILNSDSSNVSDQVNCSGKNDADAVKNNHKNSELNLRKAKALENFEKFCQRVKDGLQNQTEDFLPALEIMMKNIERKGDATEHIISGLSFFGIVSAPSLVNKGKKRSASSYNEEIVPKVHGRQMITYGRMKPTDHVKLMPTTCSTINVSLSRNQEKGDASPSLMNKEKETPESGCITKEKVPKVHGQQIITYDRKKSVDHVKLILTNCSTLNTSLSRNEGKEKSVDDT